MGYIGVDSPLITTIIPTYRRPELLRRAIRSALNQTYTFIKVCVYDNASDDETEAIVTDFAKQDSRVKYYRHDFNIGAVHNFEFGMKKVDTPFFSLLSDDDFLLPYFYEKALCGFKKFPDAMFSCMSTLHLDESGTIMAEPLSKWKDGFYEPYEGLLNMVDLSHPTWTGILFKREVLDIEMRLDQNSIPDLNFELQLAAKVPFVVNRAICAVFSCHEHSFSHNIELTVFWQTWKNLSQNIQNNDSLPTEVKLVVQEMLIKKLLRRLRSFVVQSVTDMNYKTAFDAIEIISKYKSNKLLCVLLRKAVWMCKTFPLIQITVSNFIKLRRSYIRRDNFDESNELDLLKR